MASTMEVLYKKALETQPNRREQFSQKRKEEMNQRFSTFKDAQAKFVSDVVANGQKLVNDVINSETNHRSFVDIFIFDLPPKRRDTVEVKLDDNWLYIELMEGTKRMPYSEFWNAVGCVPTLSMLQTAFAPFKVYYGYFRKLGNVIQVRWDDKVPRWALCTDEEFSNKKNSRTSYRKAYTNDHYSRAKEGSRRNGKSEPSNVRTNPTDGRNHHNNRNNNNRNRNNNVNNINNNNNGKERYYNKKQNTEASYEDVEK